MNFLGWLADNLAQILLGVGLDRAYQFVAAHALRRRFKKVFGPAAEYDLALGVMVVHPLLLQRAPSLQFAQFPLMKPGRPDMAFSAQRVVSVCEIRAVAHLVTTLRRDGGVAASVVSDESIADTLNRDWISFGAMSNLKTIDVFNHTDNGLARYDVNLKCFVSKQTGKPLYSRRPGHDYGIVLGVRSVYHPGRTWICCAGEGEWGTSGSAWYLANRWREMADMEGIEGNFLIVVEVKVGQDDSATRQLFETDRPQGLVGS